MVGVEERHMNNCNTYISLSFKQLKNDSKDNRVILNQLNLPLNFHGRKNIEILLLFILFLRIFY